MNRFQVTALANMAFDLAKAMFAVAIVPQIGLFSEGTEAKWTLTIMGVAGGVLLTMLGLYLGKEIKEK